MGWTMKTRIALSVVFILFLLFVSMGLAWSARQESLTVNSAESGISAFGDYHMTCEKWQVNGIASGGGYRLSSMAAPAPSGSGCCCTYLPVLLR